MLMACNQTNFYGAQGQYQGNVTAPYVAPAPSYYSPPAIPQIPQIPQIRGF